MIRRILGTVAIMGALVGLRASEEPPPFSDYKLVIERNVFNASRLPQREAEPAPVEVKPALPPVAKTMTLAGVFIADERTVALFVDGGRTCTEATVGQAVGGLTVGEVTSAGVLLKVSDGQELRLAVGECLSDGGTGNWTVVGRAVQAPSAQTVIDERKAADQASILQRLMERRKRELGQ